VAATEAGRCRHDKPIGVCLREHVRALVPPARPRSGADRDCPVCHTALSINIGNKGQRFVWDCAKHCDPSAVRGELQALGADAVCLGNYGSTDWVRRDAENKRKQVKSSGQVAPSTLEAERKYYVIEKLYGREFESVALLKVCLRAVIESDGNVSPDPEHLLPRDYRELAALARRAGVERCYSYKFARWWLKQLAEVRA